MTKWIIEGLDRLGKSSLIQGIIQKTGYHHIIHYSKPVKCDKYENAFEYQYKSFQYGFDLLKQNKLPIIYDRFTLGEPVYSPLYRGYSGEYVFNLESDYGVQKWKDVNLILLTSSDLSFQKDDGDSFDWGKRQEEQERFINAFEKSKFINKKIIDVHDGKGNYKDRTDILNEVLDIK